MQAILNPNLHLDRRVDVWWHPVRVDPELALFDNLAHPPRERYPDKVPLGPSVPEFTTGATDRSLTLIPE